MANILGISIGTRNVGLAVIRARKLRDFRIRTFPGKWTQEKCEGIWEVIDTIIFQNGVKDITIKMPPATHCSENIEWLVEGIKELADSVDARLHLCTIKDLKMPYTDKKGKGKDEMVAGLIERYPNLGKEWTNNKRAKVYHAKLFEAVACADLALRAGH